MHVHRWGEERDPVDRAGYALVTAPLAGHDAVFEAERLVRSRFAAWNRADSRGLRAALHVPHVSLPGHRLSIRESEPDLLGSPDFRALASVEGWHASALDELHVHQSSPDKVHCVVSFGRNAADGTRYANGQAVYVVTNRDGRWGIQLNSVTLRPIGVGGVDDGDAVASASSVLRRWVDARDGDDPAAVRRLVHLPFVELDGARLLVRRSGTALRRDVVRSTVARAGRRSDVGAVRVRERSAHKVTLETEIARHEPGGSLVGCDSVLVIVTHLQGRWALQVYSSFLTSSTENPQR
jgi:hypothetical protein